MNVNEELKFLSFCGKFTRKKFRGGGGGGGGGAIFEPKTLSMYLKPEDHWSCKRSPDILT